MNFPRPILPQLPGNTRMSMTDLSIVRRSMTSRMFSTVTTALTVAIAVALMLVLLMMRDAGFKAFQRGSGNMHMLISRDASPLVSVLNGVFYASAPRVPIEWWRYEQIASSYPFEYAVPTQQGDSYRTHPVLATTTDFFAKFRPYSDQDQTWELAEGKFFDEPFEVVVGAKVAAATRLRIGDELFLTHGTGESRGSAMGGDSDDAPRDHIHYEYTYTVVGILEPTGGPHDRALITDLTSSWIIHAHDRRKLADPNVELTTADHLIDADRLITGIYTRVASRPGRQFSAAQQQVFNELRSQIDITVADPNVQISSLFAIISNVDQILLGMAAVVMLASGIGIMLALYNSMEQRRRQIAVIRVLGASQARVFGLVMTESALFGLIGGVLGILLAIGGGEVVSTIMRQRLGLVIEPSFPLQIILYVVTGTLLLAILAGVIPSVMAYRTPVSRNLRPLG